MLNPILAFTFHFIHQAIRTPQQPIHGGGQGVERYSSNTKCYQMIVPNKGFNTAPCSPFRFRRGSSAAASFCRLRTRPLASDRVLLADILARTAPESDSVVRPLRPPRRLSRANLRGPWPWRAPSGSARPARHRLPGRDGAAVGRALDAAPRRRAQERRARSAL